ncbi:MAG: hypothetical protein M3O31_01110 [Acidobacteriota bacterium]|nr:hypothetical protein [Acidobacteriota bacterium]
MTLHKYSLIALLFAAPLLHGQTTPAPTGPVWITISAENPNIAVALPVGTTYRFGDYANNRWSDPVTVTSPTTFSPLSMSHGDPFPFSDPDYGTVKELDVLETTSAQSISITDFTAAPATTVAQIVPPLVPPTSVPVTPGTTYTLTFSNFATSPVAGQNALMLALVNAPATNANRTWEGTQMNLTIDGVTLVCTYGQTYTDGVFSLSCTVPTPPTS